MKDDQKSINSDTVALKLTKESLGNNKIRELKEKETQRDRQTNTETDREREKSKLKLQRFDLEDGGIW